MNIIISGYRIIDGKTSRRIKRAEIIGGVWRKRNQWNCFVSKSIEPMGSGPAWDRDAGKQILGGIPHSNFMRLTQSVVASQTPQRIDALRLVADGERITYDITSSTAFARPPPAQEIMTWL
jgi:hypothetical protein